MSIVFFFAIMMLVSASASLKRVLRVTRTALRTELERCIRVDWGLGRVELGVVATV